MDKLKKLIKQIDVLYIFMLLLLLGAIVTGARLFLNGFRHNFYKDASWGYYTKQLGLGEYPGSPEDVQDILGEAKRIETNGSYVRLFYDGYSLGFLDDDSSLCAIFITDSTKKLLRNGITVLSSTRELELAYAYERRMKEGNGIILGKDSHAIADGGGIWIYYKPDSDGVISEIVITNGL